VSETPRPHLLAETTWRFVDGPAYRVAVLPWGATEGHNYHLPYGTDNVLAEHVAAESARRAADRGAAVIVLPGVPFGVNTGQLDIAGTINMSPATQATVLDDVCASLVAWGVRKLVIFNGHGGNDFRQMLRALQVTHPDLFACCVNWYQAVDGDAYFDPGDHAGDLETSVMLHVAPQRVRALSEAGTGRARTFRIAALRERWAWAPRRWTQVTDDTGVGDPRRATAEKGARYVEAVVEKISAFLVDLAAADPDDLYGDGP
jgi:creatinine amidohydrolase